MSEKDQVRSAAMDLLERVVVGALNSGARAIAKAGESIAGDVKKALQNEASKAELVEVGLKMWRAVNLGDEDLPESLREEKK